MSCTWEPSKKIREFQYFFNYILFFFCFLEREAKRGGLNRFKFWMLCENEKKKRENKSYGKLDSGRVVEKF